MWDLLYGEIKLIINVGELSLKKCSQRPKKRKTHESEDEDNEARHLNMQPIHERNKIVGLHKVG